MTVPKGKAMRNKILVVSLGCSKNLVDSERLMKMLESVGLESIAADDSGEAEKEFLESDPATTRRHVVVNTCGFIGDAKEESINEILRWSALRTSGTIEGLYVMGCLSQRYAEVLPGEIPEVDRWYGKTDWPALAVDLARRHPASAPYDRVITTPRHHAYLKIAEGCDRMCAFCAIPLITGRYRSRSEQEILEEVRMLVGRGVREFNVIAQDLTSYGRDLPGRQPRIASLVRAISEIEGVEWIRLHYAYPNEFPLDLLDVMAERPNVCRYLDIALQHISDPVLANMRRHITGEETRRLLAEIRRRVPGIHLRTTLMVGFPGEGEKEFQELLDFVREQRFERLGAFAYCEEDDTYAARHLTDNVPPEVKAERLDRLMSLQEEISAEIQEAKVGSTLTVVIDREEADRYVGRSEYDSPEVDPEVLVAKTRPLSPGDRLRVRVDAAYPFELEATPL